MMMEGESGEEYMVMRKSSPPPFLLKTYMLVEEPATDNVISWNSDGTAFVVWHPADFARDLLPTLFKHCNFSSFIRQLNTYGFRKVATSRWEFCNDMFRKGNKDLLSKIKRRKTWHNNKSQTLVSPPTSQKQPQQHDDQKWCSKSPSSTSSSSSEYTSLVVENKRLKKENGDLNSELSTMKNKCKELLHMVDVYTKQDQKSEGDEEEKKAGLKLFGVKLEGDNGSIRNKRKREENNKSPTLFMSQLCK